MRTSLRLLTTLALFATFPLVGCAAPPSTTPARPAAAPQATLTPAPTAETSAPAAAAFQGTIVFDMGHGEIFSPQDTSELGQSKAIGRMQAAGFRVTPNADLITDEDLKEAAGLIIAGPMRPLQDREYQSITSFVERGGTVLLTIHVPFPVLKVPAHWGLPVEPQIIMSQSPLPGATEASIFVADKTRENPLTQGVEQVLVVSGWPVKTASDAAQLVVKTRRDSWLASPGGGPIVAPEGSDLKSYGVIGITKIGKGIVVVSGDDAIFANLAIDQADNGRLLDNIIKLMTEMNEV